MVGSQGRIDQQHLRTGRLENDEWGRLTEAVERLSKSSVFIDETPGLTGPELRARARRQARQCGRLGLIVIDYLQLMTGSGNGENRATEISEISRGLKSLAKELNCPVIALSQLNRSVETRPDKRPMMSDLRESGAIEQDADITSHPTTKGLVSTKSSVRKRLGIEQMIPRIAIGSLGNSRNTIEFFCQFFRCAAMAPGA
jgi:replicative DNA helicase